MDRRSCLAAAAVVAVLAAAPAAAQAPRTITFKERDKGSTFKFIDNPPRAANPRRARPGLGDMFVISNPLVSDSGARRGTLRASCVITGASRRSTPALCYGVFSLKEGQLVAVVSTTNIDTKVTNGAIIGGTGAYAGARGTFRSTSTKTGADDTVTLTG